MSSFFDLFTFESFMLQDNQKLLCNTCVIKRTFDQNFPENKKVDRILVDFILLNYGWKKKNLKSK